MESFFTMVSKLLFKKPIFSKSIDNESISKNKLCLFICFFLNTKFFNNLLFVESFVEIFKVKFCECNAEKLVQKNMIHIYDVKNRLKTSQK